MQRDTRIMLGSMIAMATLLVSVMVALFASTNARIDGLRGDLNSQIGRVDSRIDGLRDDFTAQFGRLDSRIDGLRDDVNVQIGSLRADMREDHAAIHTRLDSLQDGLADVGQRLARVEGRLFGVEIAVDETDGQ